MQIMALVVEVIALIGAVLAIGVAVAAKPPNDVSLAPIIVVELAVVIQVIIAVVAIATGNPPQAPLWEVCLYLLASVVVPVIGFVWALSEKDRWSNVVLAVACLTVAVMSFRIEQLWFGVNG